MAMKHFSISATYTSDDGVTYHETFPYVPAHSIKEAKAKVSAELRSKYYVIASEQKVKRLNR